MPSEERLRDQVLFSLESRWLWGHLAVSPQYLQGGYKINRMVVHSGRMRDNGHKLKYERLSVDLRKIFFLISTIKQ